MGLCGAIDQSGGLGTTKYEVCTMGMGIRRGSGKHVDPDHANFMGQALGCPPRLGRWEHDLERNKSNLSRVFISASEQCPEAIF